MTVGTRLERSFLIRPTLEVAPELLGMKLIVYHRGKRLAGMISEVEAYHQSESASHSSRGITKRTAVMFGPPGFCYVYLIYGIHHCVNVVTEPEGIGAGVLIRALLPLEGLKTMQRRRPGITGQRLTRGPGCLCAALGIDRRLYGEDLITSTKIWLERYRSFPPEDIDQSCRIGISSAKELPWRFSLLS